MEPVSARREGRQVHQRHTRAGQEARRPLDPQAGPGQEAARQGEAPGSLENPEVYENVPGHVIPILEREFDDFDTEAASFLRGEQTEEQFIGFRLKQGVYGQRQPDVQMIRVKLPFGGVTPEQMEMPSRDVVEQLRAAQQGPHHHPPEHPDPPRPAGRHGRADPRRSARPGLSSREGCGNTVRNVTGDPWAGVSDDEPFDITPYAAAYVRYFVRHPTTQLMPRKVKTAFTATDEDRAITGIHDIGFIPRVKEIDGGQVAGSRSAIGGGTSIMPRVAPTLYEFVELDNGDYLKVTEAALAHLRPPGVAAREPRPRPDQGAGRQDRHRRLPRDGRGGAPGRLGRRARLLDRPPALRR